MQKQSLIILLIILGGASVAGVSAYNGTISAATGLFNNLTVTGTYTGCGGGGEATYTNYNTVALNTTTSNDAGGTINVLISNNGNMLIEGSSKNIYFGLNGTQMFSEITNGNVVLSNIAQSETGKYQLIIDGNTADVNVYRNTGFIQKLGINFSQFTFSGASNAIAISPDGHYIAVVGPDISANDRVLVFQGAP